MPFLLRCKSALLLSVFFCLPLPVEPQSAPLQTTSIRVNVDRVNVGVVVTDSHGQFVTGLRRENFHVFDNGVEQPPTDFLSIDEPAQVLVLVEAGPAVYFLESGHLQAVSTLLDGLSPSDRVAIVSYDEAPRAILDFTADKRVAAAALDQLRFNLGFGQLNLSSSVATTLDWLARVPGKKSLVVLSTGFDTSPPAVSEKLLARLKVTDVRLLAVSLGGELRNAKPAGSKRSKKDQAASDKAAATAEGFARADEQLKALAAATGGRAYFPANAKEFSAVFAEIAQLVRHEYSLAFIPPAADGKSHTIEVRVTASTSSADSNATAPSIYRVEHRQAYLAPAQH